MEFVDDITLPDGALVEAGSCARKVWRLRMCSTQRICSSQRGCDVGGALRLVRDDVDSDDRLISRCLGAEACSYPSDASLNASLDVAVDLIFPRSPCGPYRAFFRLVRTCVPADAPSVAAPGHAQNDACSPPTESPSVPAPGHAPGVRDGPAAVDGFGVNVNGPAAVDGFGGMLGGRRASQPPSWQPVHVHSWQPVHVHSWQPVGCRLWVDVVVVPPVV